MPQALDENTKRELLPVLTALVNPVRLLFFTQKNACQTCAQQEDLLREMSGLSDKLQLEVYDFILNGDEVLKYGIDKIPATAIIGRKDYGIRFYGLTAGYEFTSLLEAVIMVSTGQSNLDPELEKMVREIKEPIHLQVMVTLTCHFCPSMVHVAHQFAFVNEHIRADMVELAEFPHLSQKYGVTAVPKTIVNGVPAFDGALPAAAAFLKIIKEVSPEKFMGVEQQIRFAQGVNKTRKADETHEYEVAIIGGGPAGMSAAVYAARKGLDVLLITDTLGGQINYTADIDNYLGFMNFSGAEMAEVFRNHLEKYPIAEAIGITVAKIEKHNHGFAVFIGEKRHFNALSVIYCAGKEYLRLGVPGEERFVGKGIGFCATCDAPLYQGKRVAVVGGGNSAFTSVRDLLNFASEIHLIARRAEFKADAPLVEEVKRSGKVTIHAPMEVKEFLGTIKLEGIRIKSPQTEASIDLPVDGVFLEIGLTPNSGPLKQLLQLDAFGQVSVDRYQSTQITGLFAAGDIIDLQEKQISIAVGQGALAGISAYKYLRDNNLTKSKSDLKELWE